ncbi:MAG: glucose 1-dehydrogenase [Acidobacteriota bacterium]
MSERFKGKVAIVTGGAVGIGRTTAQAFAAEGATVAIFDVDSLGGGATVAEIETAGGQAVFHRVDVASATEVDAAVEAVAARFGRLDIVVANAGITRDAQLVKVRDGQVRSRMSEEDFDAVVAVNLKGVFLPVRAAVPHLIKGGGGVILVASSVVGLYGNFGQTNYAATKSGVIAMVRTWARELGRYRIRVNGVAPGFVDTGMVGKMPPNIVQTVVGHTPLGRLGRPEEVANVYLWLASDEASFVHGTTISVDGGLVVGS